MDVVDLKAFYSSPIGMTARRLVIHRIRKRIGVVKGARILGLGYATPYLGGWSDDADRLLGFMPARMGVIHWPGMGPVASALVEAGNLPLPNDSIELAIVAHALEMTDDLQGMLRELWRVLAPQGRAVFVVPNRRGLWARFDHTPFGHGRPFSRQQISTILEDAMFKPVGWSHALFFPPIGRSLVLRSAAAWERLGLWISPTFSGVIIVEATKQIYAVRPRKRHRRLLPEMKPVRAPYTPISRYKSHTDVPAAVRRLFSGHEA